MLPSNCAINLSEAEQLTIDNFETIEAELDRIIELAYKYDKFGKRVKATDEWLYAYDFITLYTYLTIVKMQIDRSKADLSCGEEASTWQEYYDQ
jgi:hypothetical protein